MSDKLNINQWAEEDRLRWVPRHLAVQNYWLFLSVRALLKRVLLT